MNAPDQAGRDIDYLERGAGSPILLLLHGLAGTKELWRPLIEVCDWPGRIIAPDLPGHGDSPRLAAYSYGSLAASVVGVLPADTQLHIVGHSLGGAIGLVLASGWFGCRVTSVHTLGMKVSPWSSRQIATMRELADSTPEFGTRAEAVQFQRRMAGVDGVSLPPDVADCGRVQVDARNRFRPAWDPRSASIAATAPPVTDLLRAARADIIVQAFGSGDRFVGRTDFAGSGEDFVVLEGLGHNPHLEDPRRTWELVSRSIS